VLRPTSAAEHACWARQRRRGGAAGRDGGRGRRRGRRRRLGRHTRERRAAARVVRTGTGWLRAAAALALGAVWRPGRVRAWRVRGGATQQVELLGVARAPCPLLQCPKGGGGGVHAPAGVAHGAVPRVGAAASSQQHTCCATSEQARSFEKPAAAWGPQPTLPAGRSPAQGAGRGTSAPARRTAMQTRAECCMPGSSALCACVSQARGKVLERP